jgi:sugar lactone lactonase YvrE
MKTTILTDQLRFPECPRCHDGKLWCSDIFAGRVVQIDLQGNAQTVVEVPGTPIGLGWTPAGHLLIVAAYECRLLRLADNELVEVSDFAKLTPYPCNDLVVDGQGRAYIGNLGFDFSDPEAMPQPGSILLVTPNGNVQVVADGLAFPNGMVITPDGQTLIVAESHAARLTTFTIAADGTLTHQRSWAQFEDWGDFGAHEGQITPDGICLDQAGAVWVTSPNTKEVLRVRAGGEIVERIPLDTIPLACMLGGADRRTLFIATTESLNPYEGEAKGRIETTQVAVPGAGLP